MSHYLKLKCTALTDVHVPTLKKALKQMNSDYGISASDNFKNTANFGMDALLTINGVPTTIGFKFERNNKNQTVMTIGGEFYRTSFNNLETFKNTLCYNYSLALVSQMIKNNNYRIVKQKVDEDNTVHMTVRVAA